MPGGFRFPLQRVLDWEEQLLKREVAARGGIEADIHRLDALSESWKTELNTLHKNTLASADLLGVDLHRLTEHRATLLHELAKIPQVRARLVESLNAQRLRVVAQDRKRKILNRLKEKQQDEWIASEQKNESELASELFLASLVRAGSSTIS